MRTTIKNTICFCAVMSVAGVISASDKPSYFEPVFSRVTPQSVMDHSGIDNMDRYSFVGEPFATGAQYKLGFGKSSSSDAIEFLGSGIDKMPADSDGINANNDWIVSDQINLTGAKKPVVEFELFQNYGTDNANKLSLWICESDGYQKGDQVQKGDITSMPKGVWKPLAENLVTDGNNQDKDFELSLKEYRGKKIRIAFRLVNPLGINKNNSRAYRISDLSVEEK